MIQSVSEVLRSGKVNQWTGTKVKEFEAAYSAYFGVKHSVAVFNGTVAIDLCLKAIELEQGDEVIVTPRTFIASASSVVTCGGVPVFVDVDETSQCITLPNIQAAVTPKTRAVILVHLAGWASNVQEIADWCRANSIYLIEDCAQSHGAMYDGRYLGTFGDINAWSFCQDKIITTGGEGGMVTTNNTQLYEKAWSYKDHGKSYQRVFRDPPGKPGLFRWVHESIGTNWRMTEMQAAIGLVALRELQGWVEHRQAAAKIYDDIFGSCPELRLATVTDPKALHAYYKYYVFVKPDLLKISRDELIGRLIAAGVPVTQGSCGEVNLEKAFEQQVDLPIARQLFDTSLMFQTDPTLSLETIEAIARTVCVVIQDSS